MKILSILLVSAFLSLGVTAKAETLPLKADEIERLLSGNTAIGPWGEDEYRQYFQPNGRTIYAPRGQRSTLGGWRVNSSTNKYESEWGRGVFEAYGVVREGEQFFWVTREGTHYPFEMLEGEQLVWPQ